MVCPHMLSDSISIHIKMKVLKLSSHVLRSNEVKQFTLTKFINLIYWFSIRSNQQNEISYFKQLYNSDSALCGTVTNRNSFFHILKTCITFYLLSVT